METAMKVRIGALEVADVTLDELDELVKRYGQLVQPTEGETAKAADGKQSHKPHGHGASTDMVILRKFVEGGNQGVPTSTLGDMLGRRGKATRGAARKWAERVGLCPDPALDPFEESRVGTQRALRIKASLMDIAKAHLK
jgi:hypothetical protein